MNSKRLMTALSMVFVIALSGRADDSCLGEFVELSSLTGALPKDFVPVGHALTPGNMLFLFSNKSVIVWSPWGWETVWSVSTSDELEEVKALACSNGRAKEHLLILTSRGVVPISWHRTDKPGTVWGRSERIFVTEDRLLKVGTAEPRSLIVNPFPTKVDSDAVAYVVDYSNHISVIRGGSTLRIESVGKEPIGCLVEFTPSGYAFAWAYKGPCPDPRELVLSPKVVSVLSPTGKVIHRIDVTSIIAEDDEQREHLYVKSAWVDESRGLWFLGTSHGLAVGSVHPETREPTPQLHRVQKLGTTKILMVASFLGRLLLAVDSEVHPQDSAILIENSFGNERHTSEQFASTITFTRVSQAAKMGRIEAAIMVAPDVVWAWAAARIWEWNPSGWRLLDINRLPSSQVVYQRPLVFLENEVQFRCLRPRKSKDYRDTAVSSTARDLTATEHLCPDPSGGGVWFWESRPNLELSHPDVMVGPLFATAHSVKDTVDWTNHPAKYQVNRTIHRRADGQSHLPMACNGALLLPTSADFLLCRAGYWLQVEQTAQSAVTFQELTPGAKSVDDAAWLAIRRDESKTQRVVKIDMNMEALKENRAKLEISDLDLSAPSEAAATLMPDSEGFVWFAHRQDKGWRLLRISSTKNSDASLFAPSLVEVPRFLFLSKAGHWFGDGFLLTDTGGCRVLRADRISEGADEPTLLKPEVKPWCQLWDKGDDLAEVSSQYQVIVSRRWGLAVGDKRVVVLRNPGVVALRNTGIHFTTAFVIEPSNEGTGLKIEPASGRLRESPLREFEPFQWFLGVDEYVIGSYQNAQELSSQLLAIPVDGVTAVRSPSWLKAVGSGVASLHPGLPVNRLGASGNVLVTISGNRVSFEDFYDLTNTPLIVPSRVEVHRKDGKTESFDVRNELPIVALDDRTDYLTIHVSPDYVDWWRPDWNRVSLRDRLANSDEGLFRLWNDGPGRASFHVPMSPGVRRDIVMSSNAWPSPVPDELPNVLFSVAQTLGVNPWWLLLVLIAALAIFGILVAISNEFYHRAVEWLGFRWEFREAPSQAVIAVLPKDATTAIVRVLPDGNSRPISLPPSQSDFGGLMGFWQTKSIEDDRNPFLITAFIDGSLFRYNWNKCLSQAWTDPSPRVFSGIIFGVPPGEEPSGFPPRKGRMAVSSLGCAIREGDGPMPLVDEIVQRTSDAFDGDGCTTVTIKGDALRINFVEALERSDVCIICCHAKDGSFRFADGDFGVSEWSKLESIRVRLLIILGCGLGDLATPENPLLINVVRRGVTCIASTLSEQDVIVAKDFLPALCKEWRKGRTKGPTLAEAMRNATTNINYAADPEFVRNELNSYVIIGTPALQLQWRSAQGGT